MTKRLIEMVCKGNVTRSATAELVANNYLKKIGAADDYEVMSSGIEVDRIKSGGFSREYLEEAAKQAIDLGLGDEEQVFFRIANALRNGEDSEKLRREFISSIVAKERRERDLALKYFGVEGEAKQTSDQTIANPNSDIVLPVCKKTYEFVNGIYRNSGYSPRIDVLSALATGNHNEELYESNPQGTYREIVQRFVKKVIEHIPKAIDRILERVA